MSIDPSRAIFVQQEYRYSTVGPDAAIQAQTANATTISLDTNLEITGAAQLANELKGDLGDLKKVYKFTLRGVDFIDAGDLDGTPPVFTINAQGLEQRTMRLLSVVIDYNSWTTTIVARG